MCEMNYWFYSDEVLEIDKKIIEINNKLKVLKKIK
jgi:hypothetical protein